MECASLKNYFSRGYSKFSKEQDIDFSNYLTFQSSQLVCHDSRPEFFLKFLECFPIIKKEKTKKTTLLWHLWIVKCSRLLHRLLIKCFHFEKVLLTNLIHDQMSRLKPKKSSKSTIIILYCILPDKQRDGMSLHG